MFDHRRHIPAIFVVDEKGHESLVNLRNPGQANIRLPQSRAAVHAPPMAKTLCLYNRARASRVDPDRRHIRPDETRPQNQPFRPRKMGTIAMSQIDYNDLDGSLFRRARGAGVGTKAAMVGFGFWWLAR